MTSVQFDSLNCSRTKTAAVLSASGVYASDMLEVQCRSAARLRGQLVPHANYVFSTHHKAPSNQFGGIFAACSQCALPIPAPNLVVQPEDPLCRQAGAPLVAATHFLLEHTVSHHVSAFWVSAHQTRCRRNATPWSNKLL
eukprot:CAMPEP_0119310918 /NCGR_PEP_ID=MMETSP1333-20130426/20796_1 /TAXON_ID=418940 /ORGANISM="Scyphosphaera apsteinii, Strain RCC1455" /LENGTH=139 /DNA_ID=CAMNT_0007315181 /DNA_START=215 /DNA_END=634 /DNA_ORIENTATION=+